MLVRWFTHFFDFLDLLFGGKNLWIFKFLYNNDIAKSIYEKPWGPFIYYDFFAVFGASIYYYSLLNDLYSTLSFVVIGWVAVLIVLTLLSYLWGLVSILFTFLFTWLAFLPYTIGGALSAVYFIVFLVLMAVVLAPFGFINVLLLILQDTDKDFWFERALKFDFIVDRNSPWGTVWDFIAQYFAPFFMWTPFGDRIASMVMGNRAA